MEATQEEATPRTRRVRRYQPWTGGPWFFGPRDIKTNDAPDALKAAARLWEKDQAVRRIGALTSARNCADKSYYLSAFCIACTGCLVQQSCTYDGVCRVLMRFGLFYGVILFILFGPLICVSSLRLRDCESGPSANGFGLASQCFLFGSV